MLKFSYPAVRLHFRVTFFRRKAVENRTVSCHSSPKIDYFDIRSLKVRKLFSELDTHGGIF